MALISGTRLGPYEIHSPLGAGGMGEVYRARDTRLERTVAIKILPAHFSSDPVRRQRFEREAKAISILNHPHICVVHDIGHQDGIDYLVMECIEGETLGNRLEKGPLPLDQVVKIGAEVADALDRAHRSGIVHRDLKPGNIMLTATGAKLLDFGLAKPAVALANAATLTGSALKADSPVTEQGTIVGTFQYMSPEQVEGKEVDGRSDIFSFGAVLYEMVTGKRAFAGKSRLSVASAILEREPEPISAIRPITPPALDHVIRRCVAKNPEERWQSAADLRAEIKWAGTTGGPTGAAAARKYSTWPALVVAALLVVMALTGIVGWWKGASKPEAVLRASVLPPAGATLDLRGRNGPPALSPDGSSIAFVAVKDDKSFIWLRRLDSLEATQIHGTEGGYFPFWSPDGHYLAFFADGKLKKLRAAGGSPQMICDAEDARGGSWGKSGDIIFAPNPLSGLFRVSASGGQPVEVTKNNDFPNGGSHRWPFFLPDGRHFLYLSGQNGSEDESSAIHFASLDGSDNRVVLNASSNPVFASGYLLYVVQGTLYAAPFNPLRGVLAGEGQPVADSMRYDPLYARGIFSASENGILAYRQRTASNARLIWMDRTGKELAHLGEPAAYGGVRLSPDDSRSAISLTTANGAETWVFDTKRGTRTLLTYGPPLADVVWAPDGKWLYFAKRASHTSGIYRKAADGSGQEEQLLASEVHSFPTGISPDGKYLAFHFASPGSKLDIWILPLQGEHKPFPYLETPFSEINARFSPDGRWMAYQSNETGRAEIYVTRFPDPTGKIQVSSTGGAQPVWGRDGRNLYFLTSTDDLMETNIAWHLGNPIVGTPHKLFNAHAKNSLPSMFDVAFDGRFLVVSSGSESAAPITLVTNWTAALKK